MRRQLVQQEQRQEEHGRDGDDAAQHGAGRAEHHVGQNAEVLLGVLGRWILVVKALDCAVLARIGYCLGNAVESWSTCVTNGATSAASDRQKADHDGEEDDGSRGPSTETRLQPLDQRVERDRQERRRQRPYEHVTHLAGQIADEPQGQQADHDLRDRGRADVEGHAAPLVRLGMDFVLVRVHKLRRRDVLGGLSGEFCHVREPAGGPGCDLCDGGAAPSLGGRWCLWPSMVE